MSDGHRNRGITHAEFEVLDLLGKAFIKFHALPVIHPRDEGEFILGIHTCQNIILSRPTLENMQGLGTGPAARRMVGCSHCGMLDDGERHKKDCCLAGELALSPHNHPAGAQ